MMGVANRFYASTDDFRNPYERDRDRIIHSSSFRRLEYKTQVFINSEGDYFRTRLTHSLEVSQIARTIAKHLGLNDSLAEAIALAHDLGHTPFGHIGGDHLHALLLEAGETYGFDHNFQSFRVVTQLEKRYKEFDGLNLTYATLEGLLKHSYPYKKPFFNEVMSEAFAMDYHPSLEAMIVDKADEIAYISADIDDGLKCGLITLDDLSENPLVAKAKEAVCREGIDPKEKVFALRLTSHLINMMIFDLINFSLKQIRSRHLPVDVVMIRTLHATESLPIHFSDEIATDVKKLKKILFAKLYRHENIVRKMHFGKVCIEGLFHALRSDVTMMPAEYRLRCEQESSLRVVADFIANLSDRSAEKLYRELY